MLNKANEHNVDIAVAWELHVRKGMDRFAMVGPLSETAVCLGFALNGTRAREHRKRLLAPASRMAIISHYTTVKIVQVLMQPANT